jgi:hypothetical protein
VRDLYDVELIGAGEGKWRLRNHVFDIALSWADGLTACQVCSRLLSPTHTIRTFEEQESYSQVAVVDCPNNPLT